MRNIEMIPVAMLESHPDNPRKDLGDLTELTASIRQNGIYQNLTVVQKIDKIVTTTDEKLADMHIQNCTDPHEAEWLEELREKGLWINSYKHIVVIGHRRLAAAKAAGLERVPCAVVRMSPQKQIETMILENMQREDLTLMEQVRGFQQLLDFGDTVEEIAQKTGFSAKTVRRRTEIARLDLDTLEKVMKQRAKQITLEDFDKLANIEDLEERNRILNDIGTGDFNYKVAEAKERQENKKAKPKVMEWLKKYKVKEIKNKEYIWRDYERADGFGYSSFPMTTFLEKAGKYKDQGKEQLYYVISDLGNLTLYVKRKQESAKPGKEEPQKSAAEIKKEKAKNAAWDYLIEQSRLTYKLREEFIENLKVTKNNINIIFEGACMWAIIEGLRWGSDYPEETEFLSLLGIKGEDRGKMEGDDTVIAAVKNIKKKDVTENLAKIVWMLFADGEDKICEGGVWRGEWPEYEKDPELIAMYEWLSYLGYEISEVERGLIQGTDVNYHLGDAEKEAAE